MEIDIADHKEGNVAEEDQIDHAAYAGGLKNVLRKRTGEWIGDAVDVQKQQPQSDISRYFGRVVLGEGLRPAYGVTELSEDLQAQVIDDQPFHGAEKAH